MKYLTEESSSRSLEMCGPRHVEYSLHWVSNSSVPILGCAKKVTVGSMIVLLMNSTIVSEKQVEEPELKKRVSTARQCLS